MRTQRSNRFTREAIHGVREAVLPMPRRKVRAHLGREPDVFAHVEPISSVIRKDVVRPFKGNAQGKTAGTLRTAWDTGGGVKRKPPAQRRRSVASNESSEAQRRREFSAWLSLLDWWPEPRKAVGVEVAPVHSTVGKDRQGGVQIWSVQAIRTRLIQRRRARCSCDPTCLLLHKVHC